MENSKAHFSQRRHNAEFRAPPDLDFEYGKTLVPKELGRIHFTDTRVEKPYVSGKKMVEDPIKTR
jgi:hypothetical protein